MSEIEGGVTLNMLRTSVATVVAVLCTIFLTTSPVAASSPSTNTNEVVSGNYLQINSDQLYSWVEHSETRSFNFWKIFQRYVDQPIQTEQERTEDEQVDKKSGEEQETNESTNVEVLQPIKENPSVEVQPSSEVNAFEQEVVALTNIEREKQGLQPLQLSEPLSKVARAKSQDMVDNNYFSHQSPTYGSPFDMMKEFGINYRTAGENIAMGHRTPEQVVQGWMNSEGHRANILNGNFTHIGLGYVEANGSTYWTQMFIGK